METRTIFFVGKPGCGKGTQAQLLSEKTLWPVISSGKLFREIAKQDTAVGRKVKEENYAGILQPHWFAMHLYLSELFKLSENTSAIFDGFNRKIQEAQLIVDSLKWFGRSYQVIQLTISDETMRARLASRHRLEVRPDDNTFGTRLEEYEIHTSKAIELFRKEGVLLEVNGEQTPEEIAREVQEVLKIV